MILKNCAKLRSAVIKAAPIVRWMIGKTEEFVKGYCARKKFKLNDI